MSNVSTSIEERALKLLGSGVGTEQVASTLGVTPSAISQLLGQEEFHKKVLELRFEILSKHNETDAAYDTIEKQLQERFKTAIQWGLTKPMEVLKALSEINKMKRRGQSAPTHITNQQTVVNLVLPTQIIQQFSKNSSNQVVKAGNQELITIQSGQMGSLLERSSRESGERDIIKESSREREETQNVQTNSIASLS